MASANFAALPASSMALFSASMPRLYHECDIQRNTNVIRRCGAIGAVKTIALRLAWARSQLKISQEQVAVRAGVKQGTIGNIENGLRQKPREVVAIAKAVGVRPEWLSSGKGPVYPNSAPDDAEPWPFERIDPSRWGALKEREKGAVEAAALKVVLEIEATRISAGPSTTAVAAPRKQAGADK